MRRLREDQRLIPYRVQMADMVFLFAVLSGIAGSYLVSYTGIARDHYQLGILFSELVYFLPVGIFFGWEKKKGICPSVKKSIRLSRIKPVTVVLSVLFSISIYPVVQLVNMISLIFVKNKINAAITASVQELPVWMGLFVFALVPAVTEEVIYRGFFYQSYRELGRKKGVVASALIFGMMHLNFNQFLYAFFMGTVFALLMEITDSIWPCMLAHFMINGSSVILSTRKLSLPADRLALLVVAGAVISILLLFLMAKQENFSEKIQKEEKKKRRETSLKHPPGPYFLAAGSLCIFLMILGEIS